MVRMQVFQRRFLIAASIFLVVLTFPAFVNPTPLQGDGVAPDSRQKSGIYIKASEDFNEKYDFAGEGTEDDPFIIEGLVFQVRGYGIRIRNTDAHFIIRDCVFEAPFGKGGTAIYLSKVANGIIENSEISNMNRGVAIHKSENIVIQGLEIDSVRVGIRIKHSAKIQISNNRISNARFVALYIAYSNDCTVIDNTISNNDGIGVLLYDSSACILYGNYLASNDGGNARDIIGEYTEAGTNMWDDGVSFGNEWGDYEGTGVYLIPGNRGSVDRYPIGSQIDTIAPEWNSEPQDQTVEYNTDFVMMLEATDANGISYYSVSDEVHFSVDSEGKVTNKSALTLGEYQLEVAAYDPSGNFCSATITVTVQDTVSPEWLKAPEDLTIECGSELEMILQATDANGISSFWVSNTELFEVDSDGRVTDKIALDIGEYTLEVRAYDPSNNYCSATLTIVVQDSLCPTISSPEDVTYKQGETGNTLAWVIADNNPASYAVYLDNVLIEEGQWAETVSTVEVSIDGLGANEYLYRLEVYDLGGNTVFDEVNVTVTPRKTIITTITTDPPIPIPGSAPEARPLGEQMLIITGIGLPVLGVAGAAFILGRRRESS
ncbi:MAG: right-handed parallel beta-helix repeat-containing protein [Candidatus Thorarchaeota archaeon]